MANIPLTDFMVRGQIYTFTWEKVGTGSAQDFVDAANSVAGVSQAYISASGGMTGAGQYDYADTISITFAYVGQGSDRVSDLQAEISNNFPSTNENFLSATVPGVAPPQISMETSAMGSAYGAGVDAADTLGKGVDAVAAGIAKIPSFIPSASALWAVAAIGILVLFVYVGGAGVVKRNL